MQYYANFIGDRWHSTKKATLYAKEFHPSKVILTFSIYLFHFIAGRKKIYSLRTQFAAELILLFITKAAAFHFCERVQIILTNEEQQWIDKAHNTTTAVANSKEIP